MRNRINKDSIFKARNILLLLGILIMLIVVGLLVVETIIDSEVGIARANLYVNAIPLSFSLMLLWMIILPTNKSILFTIMSKAILVFVFVLLVISTFEDISIKESLEDIEYSEKEDYEIVKGVVKNVKIIQRSSGRRKKVSYREAFTINGNRYSISVDNKNDYVIEEGKTYEMEVLPNSRTIVKYKEIE